ncbi:hypothetical protein 7F8_21 [uncultured Caudovirales phage]|uniref:Uncharacterized protein n=1 Tax=uncultured Caudovirales phage TaxID=2100421 RepID=A0A2H4J8S6_9CAUD|nr:hypothetical protein 7AX4_43 [uncultured Caudovirales phage]ASN70344.1 hypothetical protein 8AX11_21 [uncultured Caudovirales phage]ASN70403.1 hypothetical protein 7F8_21 [uncultured Caudovirales phage]
MNVEAILANYDFSQVQVLKSIAPLLLAGLIVGAISLAVGIYTFLQMRKMQKKNRPKPNQIDGTIADEGVSFCDIAGSPHIHPNITDLWNKKSDAIKQKSGGFLGIGKTSQVTGYRYYTSFAAFIGNRIEKFIAINFDNRGWIVHDPTKHPVNMLPINAPSLFGQDAGGVVGNIDLEFGFSQPQQNLAYKQHFDLVSAYPYQSYLVFRGNTIDQPFYFGNSNYMKEMLLWVKRTRVRNDGQGQWYEVRGDGAIVCEIDAESSNMDPSFDPSWKYKHNPVQYRYKSSFNNIWNNKESYNYNNNYILEFATSGTSSGVQQLESGALEMYLNYEGLDGWAEFIVTLLGEETDIKIKSIFWPNVYELNPIESNVHKVYSLKLRVENTVGNLSIDFSRTSISGTKFDVTLSTGPIYPYFYNGPALQAYDINPIHKIREILTDDTSMGKPEADVNDINFMKAADRIWDEGLGVSWAIDEKSCIDAIEELCYHIEAGVRVNRQTGLYEMVLFRDDWFSEDEIRDIAESKIKDLSLEVMNSDDIVNQLNVTYYDRERIKNSTFSVYENGSILTMGKANAESIDFPYFMNMRNAEIVANWKLKQYSTPAWKGTLTTGWREARKWNRYDLVKITWSKKWQDTILARIMKIDLGNGLNNEVMIDFEEVVPYSGEMNTSIVVDDSTEEKAEPAKPAIGETFEAPYYLAVQNIGQRKVDEELAHNPDVGFTFSTYRRPQWNALYTEITTINADDPENGWVVDGNAEFVTGGQFDQVVSRAATQIVVKNINIEGLFGSGDLIVAGTWLAGVNGLYEFMIVESFDSETNILTVKRGALDTIPTQWDINGWFFVSNADDGLFSLTEYSAGDNVRVSSLTVTPGSKLEHLGSAPVYMRSRAIRPYPPANVKINGEYFPDDIETDLVITWSDRNRLNLNIIDWYSPSVTIEQNTQTHLIISQLDEDQLELATSNVNVTGATSYTMPIATMQADTRFVKVTLKTVRDDYECLQPFEHIFELSQFFSAPYDLTVEFKND